MASLLKMIDESVSPLSLSELVGLLECLSMWALQKLFISFVTAYIELDTTRIVFGYSLIKANRIGSSFIISTRLKEQSSFYQEEVLVNERQV